MNELKQFLIDWKMALFRGGLGAVLAMATQIGASLNDYTKWEDIDTLSWSKIEWSVVAAVCTYLIGFMDNSVGRAREAIKQRMASAPPQPHTDNAR